MSKKFETLGCEKLKTWVDAEKIGASELARRMSTEAHTVLPSTVSRWLGGDARPDPQYRPILKHLANIPEADWLTAAERNVIEAAIEKGSAA